MTRDLTIPRHAISPPGHTTVWGPTWARLVDYGDDLALVDCRTGWSIPCNLSNVQILMGSFGNTAEGVQSAPRPWKFDAHGQALVEGDNFLVVFLGNDHRHPVIIGGVRPPNPDDPDFFAVRPIGGDPNPIRLRKAVRNDAGAITGTLEVRALDGGSRLEVVVGGSAFGEGVGIVLDYDAGKITLSADTITLSADTEAVTDAPMTKLGGVDASDPVVTETRLLAAIATLVSTFNAHTHAVAGVTAGGAAVVSAVPAPLQTSPAAGSVSTPNVKAT